MRQLKLSYLAMIAAAIAPVAAQAAPLRAAGALPAASRAGVAVSPRAATPVKDESQLALGLLPLLIGAAVVTTVVVVAATSGRSPG